MSELAALLHAITAVMGRPGGDPERERVIAWKLDLIARIEAANTIKRPDQAAPAQTRSLSY